MTMRRLRRAASLNLRPTRKGQETEYITGWLEVYTGLVNLDSTTLDGTIEGVISSCEAGSANSNCGLLNTGPIDLIFIACP